MNKKAMVMTGIGVAATAVVVSLCAKKANEDSESLDFIAEGVPDDLEKSGHEAMKYVRNSLSIEGEILLTSAAKTTNHVLYEMESEDDDITVIEEDGEFTLIGVTAR